jgi:TIR domain
VANSSFAITAAGATVRLDASGKARVSFTVANTSPLTLRGLLLVRPVQPAKPEWFSIVGESIRDFAPYAAEQIVIQLNVPPTTPPGTYSFRLDATNEAEPDEDYTEGPLVAFDVSASPPPAKKSPWSLPRPPRPRLPKRRRRPETPGPSAGERVPVDTPQTHLGQLLRDAALAGVVPARSSTSRARRRPPPKSVGPPMARAPLHWLARVVTPLLVLGGLAAAARWLFGLFVASDEPVETPDDLVQCTVFAPPSTAPGDSILVQVFVHLPEKADDARAIASELDVDARRRAFRSLDAPVRLGAQLDFELRLPGLHVDDPVASLVWHRMTDAVQFGVAVPADTPARTVIGTVSVAVDSVPVGHIKFKLAITPEAAELQSEPQGADVCRYRFAFISYSSNDRSEVMRRVQLLSAVGIDFFQDLLSLEPGDRWAQRIELGIDECDLFLLFWSSEAKRSEWVRREVRHALARKRENDLRPPEIRPIVIEGPPIVEPWEELAHLHFNDRLLYFIGA